MSSICGTFLNCNETIGIIIGQGTQTSTGSIFITLLLILLLILAVAMLFGIRLEYTSIFVLPLLLAYASFYSEYIAILIVILIYLSIILTKNWLFK